MEGGRASVLMMNRGRITNMVESANGMEHGAAGVASRRAREHCRFWPSTHNAEDGARAMAAALEATNILPQDVRLEDLRRYDVTDFISF